MGKRKNIDPQAMINDYRSGLSLRLCAAKYGCSVQNVHQIIATHAPHLMREPHVSHAVTEAIRG